MIVFLKKENIAIYCLAYGIAIFRNTSYCNPCIVIHIISPDSCQHTALFTADTTRQRTEKHPIGYHGDHSFPHRRHPTFCLSINACVSSNTFLKTPADTCLSSIKQPSGLGFYQLSHQGAATLMTLHQILPYLCFNCF